MISIAQALRRGTQAIQSQRISQTPLLDASVLLCHATGLTREELYSRSDTVMEDPVSMRFSDLVHQRCEGEPVAYLIGTREFFGHAFMVTNDVLIPRADTETLVEQALAILGPGEDAKVLDLCTGSGCIGISVAAQLSSAQVTLSDISEAALAIAAANSRAILGHELEIIQSNLFSALQNRRFHMIMTNPPYLTDMWYEETEQQVKREPAGALIGGGEDGLDIIRKIVDKAPIHLEDGGVLLIECDYRQNDLVARMLAERGFSSIVQGDDLAQLRRIVWGTCHV